MTCSREAVRAAARLGSGLALVAALAAARPTALAAQDARRDCVREQVDSLGAAQLRAWAGFRPADIARRLEPLRRAGQWTAAVDSLDTYFLVERGGASAVGGRPPSTMAGLEAGARATLTRQLDSLRQELQAGERDTAVRLRGQVTLKRFDVTPSPIPPFTAVLFEGREGVDEIVITDSVPTDTRRTVCWLSLAATELATHFGGPGREAIARAFAQRVVRWDNFMQRGYSMLPHELLVNGFMPRARLEPPRVQLVLLHPSAGTQVVGERLRLSELERMEVLAVEPAGVLVYGPQHRWYLGASWLVTFPADPGAGHGAMLHLGRFGRAGYVWRPRAADGRRRNGVLLSLDAYRYLSGVAEQRKRLQQSSIGECLQDVPACAKGLTP